jgi:hypothetical protein
LGGMTRNVSVTGVRRVLYTGQRERNACMLSRIN